MEMVYCLPAELVVPTISTTLSKSIIDIKSNGSLVMVKTIPGAASIIARLLDPCGSEEGIMGTIAGDDSVLVVPNESVSLNQLMKSVTENPLFYVTGNGFNFFCLIFKGQ